MAMSSGRIANVVYEAFASYHHKSDQSKESGTDGRGSRDRGLWKVETLDL